MENFSLRFKISQIHLLAKEYENSKYFTKSREEGIEEKIAVRTKKVGYFTHQDFLVVCTWKSPRPFKRYEQNSPEFIKEVTKTALSSPNEQLRIEILTLLRGVSWPTASVLLHFGSKGSYPILDFRALWSLKTEVPKQYDFSFWWAYALFCRNLSKNAGVTMRTLDRALWQYSKTNQRKS